MKPSILRNLLIGCVSFGLIMGAVFPFFADLFVEWKDGMFGWFVASCLVAGVACGSAIYWLVHAVLLKRLKRISEIANAISQNDISHVCEMQSDDMIGDIVGAFNQMAANAGMLGFPVAVKTDGQRRTIHVNLPNHSIVSDFVKYACRVAGRH